MKKQIVFLLIFFSITVNVEYIQAEDSFGRQMFKKIHLGWDVNRTDDYRWSNINLGTAYGKTFESDFRASWQIGVDYNWSKYTLYSDGAYYVLSDHNSILRTRSLSFPLTVEYNVYKSFFSGVKVYTGPVYELILSSKLDGNYFSGLKNSQLGWTFGTKIRFFAIFTTRVAYSYYPTGLFVGGGLNRSAINLSLGF